MPAKPNPRNWNDVQTAIAAVAIVGTLGLWNLFAAPSEKVSAASDDAVVPPIESMEEPGIEDPVAVMPQVKIMFTQAAPQTQTTVVQQTLEQKKKNKKNNNNGGSVTQTRTS